MFADEYAEPYINPIIKEANKKVNIEEKIAIAKVTNKVLLKPDLKFFPFNLEKMGKAPAAINPSKAEADPTKLNEEL